VGVRSCFSENCVRRALYGRFTTLKVTERRFRRQPPIIIPEPIIGQQHWFIMLFIIGIGHWI
jgi:hypothetical protein